MSEDLARKFHEAYERLAPSFGYETRKETREFDPQSNNGHLMIAVCAEVLAESEQKLARYTRLSESGSDADYLDRIEELETQLAESAKEIAHYKGLAEYRNDEWAKVETQLAESEQKLVGDKP